MKHFFSVALLSLMATAAMGQPMLLPEDRPPPDRTQRTAELLAELREFRNIGAKIDRRESVSDDALRSCAVENKPRRDRVKMINKEVSSWHVETPGRMYLLLGADEVFSCLYCGGSGKSCKKAVSDLDAVEAALKN